MQSGLAHICINIAYIIDEDDSIDVRETTGATIVDNHSNFKFHSIVLLIKFKRI